MAGIPLRPERRTVHALARKSYPDGALNVGVVQELFSFSLWNYWCMITNQ